jgi:hypothetical protein
LVCPKHHSPLFRNETALFCRAEKTFDILDGIPGFTNGSAYVDAFGAQWKRYRLTQLDSHTGTTITADRLRRCWWEDIWHGLTGKTVLECGCGAGRFTEVLLRRHCVVTSVDLVLKPGAGVLPSEQSAAMDDMCGICSRVSFAEEG